MHNNQMKPATRRVIAAAIDGPATHKGVLRSMREAIDAARRAIVARIFLPNDQGNYVFKRVPRPAGQPIEPRERFARLQADYLASAMTYRNPPTRRDSSPGSPRVAALSTTQRQIFHAA